MNRTISLPGPTFLYIGAQKSGSTWIHAILKEHPEVFVPVAKDLTFFDKHYERGMEWYCSFFRASGKAKAIGEVSHDYFLSPETARRIHRHLPDVKLICCLRNPVERILSAYVYYKKVDLSPGDSFADFMFRPDTVKHSSYYSNLLPYFELFARENILVLFFDELAADPAAFARKIYSFIGVDPDFVPSMLHQKLLPSAEPRWGRLALFVYQLAAWTRQLGFVNFLGKAKRNVFLNRLLYKEVRRKPDIPESEKDRLRDHFKKDYEKLSALIGRPVPSSWFADTPSPSLR